jgi:hypothetical protein
MPATTTLSRKILVFIVSENLPILLVILFPRDMAATTTLDCRCFWAFNAGTFEARFSAFGG